MSTLLLRLFFQNPIPTPELKALLEKQLHCTLEAFQREPYPKFPGAEQITLKFPISGNPVLVLKNWATHLGQGWQISEDSEAPLNTFADWSPSEGHRFCLKGVLLASLSLFDKTQDPEQLDYEELDTPIGTAEIAVAQELIHYIKKGH